MDFYLFGGVRVLNTAKEEIPLGRKQRQMLSLMMLFPSSTLPPDILIDFLWSNKLPANPTNSLQDLIKRLRLALGDFDRTTIVTRNGGYGLFVDPHSLDVEIFRRLALAGLRLEKAEPLAAELLLARAMENARGDLPDIAPDFRASEQVDELYGLRAAAAQALLGLERSELEDGLSDEAFAIWSVEGRPVGLALRVEELGEIAIADLVGSVARFSGRIHQLSRGVMLASFSDGGSALRAAFEMISDVHLAAGAIDCGAICHMERMGPVNDVESLMELNGRAQTGQILVSDRVYRSAAAAMFKNCLESFGPEVRQFQFGQSRAAAPANDFSVERSAPQMAHAASTTGRRHVGRMRMTRSLAEIFVNRGDLNSH